MRKLNLTVAGMGCDHCVTRVSNALNGLDGVHVDSVSASMGIASITYDPAKTGPETIANTLDHAGFPTQVPTTA